MIKMTKKLREGTKNIEKDEKFNLNNIWVKRPGTGQILAKEFHKILNKKAQIRIPNNTQLEWNMIEDS